MKKIFIISIVITILAWELSFTFLGNNLMQFQKDFEQNQNMMGSLLFSVCSSITDNLLNTLEGAQKGANPKASDKTKSSPQKNPDVISSVSGINIGSIGLSMMSPQGLHIFPQIVIENALISIFMCLMFFIFKFPIIFCLNRSTLPRGCIDPSIIYAGDGYTIPSLINVLVNEGFLFSQISDIRSQISANSRILTLADA
jgi:hypothetical protein